MREDLRLILRICESVSLSLLIPAARTQFYTSKMGTGTTVLRGWLVLNGLYIDIIALYLLPVFFGIDAPWPAYKDIFGTAGAAGAPLATTDFATRQIANSFLFHGIVRAAAGIWGASTAAPALGWVAVASYLCEAANFGAELPHGTVTDPAGLALCPVLAYCCYACLVCGGGAAAADGKKKA